MPLELPRIAAGTFGAEARTVWGIGWSEAHGFLAQVTAIDLSTGAATQAPLAPWEYAGEPVPVAKANPMAPPYLLSVVLDARARRSRVDVLDAADLSAPPVAQVRLPYAMPFGFHGGWAPDPRPA